MNYADHCKEQNVPVPKEPIIFSKFASSIVGPYDEIVLPPESQVGAFPLSSCITGAITRVHGTQLSSALNRNPGRVIRGLTQ